MTTPQNLLSNTEEEMKSAQRHVEKSLAKIRAGRALPSMLDDVVVCCYGNSSPLRQIASVSTLDVRTLSIKPWDGKLLAEIERAVLHSNLGITPQNDGQVILLKVPVLTEERRKQLVKQVRQEIEKGKIVIRTARKNARQFLLKSKAEGLSEDDVKALEEQIQKAHDAYVKSLDDLSSAKEADLMTV